MRGTKRSEDLIAEMRSYITERYFDRHLTEMIQDAIDTIESLEYELEQMVEQDQVMTNGYMLQQIIKDNGCGIMVTEDERTAEGWIDVLIDTDWWDAPAVWGGEDK